MDKRQEQLQKLWEEFLLDNLEDLVKNTQISLDSAVDAVKSAAGNIPLERANLEALGVAAIEAMDREKLEHWLREGIRSLDREKLEAWARQSLSSIDSDKYRKVVRDKMAHLDRETLEEIFKASLRRVDLPKLQARLRERLRILDLGKIKAVAREGLGEMEPHWLEEYFNSRVDKVVRARLDALSAAELELLLKEKQKPLVPVIPNPPAKIATIEIAQKGEETRIEVKEERSHPLARLIGTSFRFALLGAAGWIAYSHFFLEHQVPLPKAIAADLLTMAYRPSGPINVYQDRSGSGRPLVLIHSINAAASSFEMRPLFQHYRGQRPVFALDLPGFGFSARPNIEYSPELYVNAILTMLTGIDSGPADVVALSLSSEFAAEAARRRPELFHSLSLISPTGLYASEGGGIWDSIAYPLLSLRLWARPFFDLLTTKQGISYFLQKSFVGPVPDGMVAYDISTSHQPGAEHAPLHFVSGKLATPNAIERIYRLVKTPTVVLYDNDAYVRFDRLPELLATNKAWQATRITPTLGLPHWEKEAETTQALDQFWQSI